jgi:hypothetical protein
LPPEEFRNLVIKSVDDFYDEGFFEKNIKSVEEHKVENIRKLVKKRVQGFSNTLIDS